MRVKVKRCFVLSAFAVMLIAALGSWAAASVVWDGSGDPANYGFTYKSNIPGEPDGVQPDPFTFDWCNGQACTGIAYQNTSTYSGAGVSGAYYSLPTAATELVRASGWSMETRVQVKGNTGDLFGLYMGIADDMGGFGLLLRSTDIQVYGSDFGPYPSPLYSIPINGDFHDIRIQVAAGGTSGDVFVDDMTTPAATITLPNDPGARFNFGDGSSSSAGVAYWDHVVVNAAAPAPTTPPLPPGSGLNIDATFESGALPTDFGMVIGGNVDPTTNVSGGVWNNNRIAGEMSSWKSATLCGDIVGPVIHGFAEIDGATLTGSSDDQTVMALGTDVASSLAFVVGFVDGKMTCFGGSSYTGYEAAVANQDGGKHVYGWEVDLNDRILKLFFDDVQVGEAEGYNVTGNVFGEELMYFGDASGGKDHSEIWERWVVAEGEYPEVPEPSMLVLFGIGATLLGVRQMRRR